MSLEPVPASSGIESYFDLSLGEAVSVILAGPELRDPVGTGPRTHHCPQCAGTAPGEGLHACAPFPRAPENVRGLH